MMKLRGDVAQPPTHLHLRADAPPRAKPTTEDGRNIDPEIGTLLGEASAIASREPAKARALGEDTIARITTPEGASTTYYEQPILKTPVWKAWIPTYFFVGGVAGGCMAMGAAAQLAGGRKLRGIVMPARAIAAGAVVASAGLLIADLGRPARFLNMLRVFRPTSPMNMGTWILTGAGATTTASAALPFFGMNAIADAAGLAAGMLGLGLASYTGVLIANTAVPAWQHAGKELPALFVASSAASAAAALDLAAPPSRATDVLGIAGKIGELACGLLYERALARRGASVVRHLRTGRAHGYLRASQALTLASLGASLFGWRRASGVLGLAGALSLRFAVMAAGRSSARDPRATFEPQRAGTAHASRRPSGSAW